MLHGSRARVLRLAEESGAVVCGGFAGKEAVGKALGLGVARRRSAWREIEIVGRPKPSVTLHGRAKAWAERVGAGAIDLSMTHSRELATAVAVVDEV